MLKSIRNFIRRFTHSREWCHEEMQKRGSVGPNGCPGLVGGDYETDFLQYEFLYLNRKQRNGMAVVPIDDPQHNGTDNATYLQTIPDNHYRPDQGWYDDLSEFAKTLTPLQQKTFEKMLEGKGNVQIAKEEGCNTSCITARIDRIRLLFSRYYDIPEYYQGKKEFRPRGRPRKDKKNGTH